ncbi:unnamed protein product [Mytilus coruscus]|uniref:PHD-type domain-containing protein n=1 Tax=Mytilus coruscus TaxID=42192 RepID=A0A6J8BG81_MYTCO|nr:unnamed protein product [Mytilus coruscus]
MHIKIAIILVTTVNGKWVHLDSILNDEEKILTSTHMSVFATIQQTPSKKYSELQNSEDKWFCKNRAAPCGICTLNILNSDPAIECDKCKLWIHNTCVIVSDAEYKVVQATNCTWICPSCHDTNLSTSFSSVASEAKFDSVPYSRPSTSKIRKINVTSKGVEKMLKNTNAIKAIGPDGIHSRVLMSTDRAIRHPSSLHSTIQ